jgi:hypothetical protein
VIESADTESAVLAALPALLPHATIVMATNIKDNRNCPFPAILNDFIIFILFNCMHFEDQSIEQV